MTMSGEALKLIQKSFGDLRLSEFVGRSADRAHHSMLHVRADPL